MAEFTTSDGVRIVYDDIGPGSGDTVVLCHGLAAAGEQMASDAAYFAARGYRVLVPDIRGHGRSGTPDPLTSQSLAVSRIAQDLGQMLEHAQTPPVHWVGNSLGGIAALDMLAQHERRFRTLATFGTAYKLSLPAVIAPLIPLSYRVVGRWLTGTITAITTTRNKAAQPLIAKLVSVFDPKVGGLLAAHLTRFDYLDNATAARLPILLLRGGRDTGINAGLGPTIAAMRGRPNFTLVDLPEGGHCANLDATDQWRDALLTFWTGK